MRVCCLMGIEFVLQDENFQDMLHNVNILNSTELYTEKWLIKAISFSYMFFILIFRNWRKVLHTC